jgi:hypothetical protein
MAVSLALCTPLPESEAQPTSSKASKRGDAKCAVRRVWLTLFNCRRIRAGVGGLDFLTLSRRSLIPHTLFDDQPTGVAVPPGVDGLNQGLVFAANSACAKTPP